MQSFWRAAAPDKNTRTGKGERLWQKQNVHTPIVNVRRRSAKQVQRGRRSIAVVTARVRVRRATAVVSAAIRAVSTRKRSRVFNSLTNDPQARLGIDVAVSRDMKILRTMAIMVIVLAAISWGIMEFLHANSAAISWDRSFYLVGGLAVMACLAILAFGDSRGVSNALGRLGQSSGAFRGPAAGDGAVIHHSSGEADFDGRAGDTLPPVKSAEHNQPYPRDRSAD